MLGEFLSKKNNRKFFWIILGLCILLIVAGLILSQTNKIQ